MQLVDRKIKREGKGSNSKIQKNGGTTNTHARHLESNYKPKRADRAPSVKGKCTSNCISFSPLLILIIGLSDVYLYCCASTTVHLENFELFVSGCHLH